MAIIKKKNITKQRNLIPTILKQFNKYITKLRIETVYCTSCGAKRKLGIQGARLKNWSGFGVLKVVDRSGIGERTADRTTSCDPFYKNGSRFERHRGRLYVGLVIHHGSQKRRPRFSSAIQSYDRISLE